MIHLVCPGCGVEVSEVSYSKKFVFVDGVRHDTGWTWDFTCCGAQVLDSQIEFTADECDGFYHSSLTDEAGRVVLSWLDDVEEKTDD